MGGLVRGEHYPGTFLKTLKTLKNLLIILPLLWVEKRGNPYRSNHYRIEEILSLALEQFQMWKIMILLKNCLEILDKEGLKKNIYNWRRTDL